MLALSVYAYDDGSAHGFFPVEGRHLLLLQHVWVSWVAGLWHYAESAQETSFAPGAPLALVPEPQNPEDPLAVGVWDNEATSQIGWIPRTIARDLTPEIRVGLSLLDFVEDGQRTALLLAASREPIRMDVVDRPMPEHGVRAAKHKIDERPVTYVPDPEVPIDPVEAMRQMLEGEKTD